MGTLLFLVYPAGQMSGSATQSWLGFSRSFQGQQVGQIMQGGGAVCGERRGHET